MEKSEIVQAIDESKKRHQEYKSELDELSGRFEVLSTCFHEFKREVSDSFDDVHDQLDPISEVANKVKIFFEVSDCIMGRIRKTATWIVSIAGAVAAIYALVKFF